MLKKKLNILLVDDHKTTNILNTILLEKSPSINIVKAVNNMVEAMNAVIKFSPEIVLIDRDLIFEREDIYNELSQTISSKTLVILLSNNHLCESYNKKNTRKLQLPEIKFKVLTKNVISSILKSYKNNYYITASA